MAMCVWTLTVSRVAFRSLSVQQDKSIAARNYNQAGLHGDAQGLFNVATMYLFGDGVEADLEQAHHLLLAAHFLHQAPIATHLALAYIKWLRIRAYFTAYFTSEGRNTTAWDRVRGVGESTVMGKWFEDGVLLAMVLALMLLIMFRRRQRHEGL